MRVIREKKTNNEFPKEIICERCGSDLEIDKYDIKEGYLGQAYVECPVCGEKTYNGLEDYNKDITIDSVKYPDNFYCFKDGVKLSSDEVEKYIKDIVGHFRREPESFVSYAGSGNSVVIGFNFSGDEEYVIIVAQGYYETSIPYDREDYDAQNSIDWGWKNMPASNCNVSKIRRNDD